MTDDPTAVAPEANAGEGWLMLRVALPRLARRLERVHAWLDRYAPERFVDAADELRGLAGAEGLALLAAVPPDRRGAALERVELEDKDREGLRALAERLGDPEDDRSPAAGLVRMAPSVARAALEVPGDDPRGVAALLAQARQAYLRGELRSARESAERGLERLRAGDESANLMLKVEALNLLGLIFAALGEPSRAIELYEQALEIAREVGDRGGEGNVLGNLGSVYYLLGQRERAVGYHEQALAISRETGDRRGESSDLGNLGGAYLSLGQVERAVGYYEQALAISRETGDRHGEASDLGNLGNAYAALGQLERAVGYQQQALAVMREVGDRLGEASICWNMGRALLKLGRVAEALTLMRVCVTLLREIGHPESEKRAATVEIWRRRLAEQGQG